MTELKIKGRHYGIWDDEENIKLLYNMWNKERTSAALIAKKISKRMGYSISRNSIIGKIHRMGWKRGRGQPKSFLRLGNTYTAGKQKPRRKRNPRANFNMTGKHSSTREKKLAREIAYLKVRVSEDTPIKPPITLLQLGPRTCRWPYGDPQESGFGFCGCACNVQETYCDKHAARAYAG